jgi:membrane associated rhomboid family serine protease
MRINQSSNINSLPEAVKHILIINILLFVTTLAFATVKQTDLGDYLALHSLDSPLFKPWQIITHMFMHGDVGKGPEYLQSSIWHILGNMFGLWMFGSILERNWGSKKFVIFYLLCGLGAAIAHLMVLHYENGVMAVAIQNFNANPTWAQFNLFVNQNVGFNPAIMQYLDAWQNDANNPGYVEGAKALLDNYKTAQLNQGTVGASGAVFGILAAYAYYFPNTLLYIYFFFPIKAKWAILAYAAYELFSGMRHSAGDNVAHFAHLGGALVGFLLVIYWNKTQRNTFY